MDKSSAFVPFMLSDNDNRPPAEASRVLPILGQVGPDGRLILARPLAADVVELPARLWPSDPREA